MNNKIIYLLFASFFLGAAVGITLLILSSYIIHRKIMKKAQEDEDECS